MLPKEKAIELVENYLNNIEDKTGTFLLSTYSAKQCAIIAVDEILYIIENGNPTESQWNYWQEVRNQIERL